MANSPPHDGLHDGPHDEQHTPPRAPRARSSALPPSATQPLQAAVRLACERYYAGLRTPDADLRAAVCAAVDALRLQGLPITVILPAVRTVIAQGSATPQRLVDHAVRWCIGRYFANNGEGETGEGGAESPRPFSTE